MTPAMYATTGVDDEPLPALRLSLSAPNPFSSTTTIRFELPFAGRALVRVYDVAGRLVSVLADGEFGPGRHEVVWDGRCAGGADAAAGVYFYSVECGGLEARQKTVLLR